MQSTCCATIGTTKSSIAASLALQDHQERDVKGDSVFPMKSSEPAVHQ